MMAWINKFLCTPSRAKKNTAKINLIVPFDSLIDYGYTSLNLKLVLPLILGNGKIGIGWVFARRWWGWFGNLLCTPFESKKICRQDRLDSSSHSTDMAMAILAWASSYRWPCFLELATAKKCIESQLVYYTQSILAEKYFLYDWQKLASVEVDLGDEWGGLDKSFAHQSRARTHQEGHAIFTLLILTMQEIRYKRLFPISKICVLQNQNLIRHQRDHIMTNKSIKTSFYQRKYI